jgi:hypothetical protein
MAVMNRGLTAACAERRITPGRRLDADADRIARACHHLASRFGTGDKVAVSGKAEVIDASSATAPAFDGDRGGGRG